jgi:acyl carrier protein
MTAATMLDVLREALGACEGFSPRIALADLNPVHRLVEDIGLDSVALLDLAMGLESRLGRAVDEADLARLKTVEDLAAFLESM